MRRHLFSKLILITVVVLAAVSAQAQNPNASDISFTISMPEPWTHLLRVEMRMQIAASLNVPNESDLVMPVWTPGSYLIREYERNVQGFAASDANGRALEWAKINKNTWRVKTSGARRWQVSYRVYANELTVRTNEMNADHAFWNNAALLMYPEGKLSAPATVRVIPYGNRSEERREGKECRSRWSPYH